MSAERHKMVGKTHNSPKINSPQIFPSMYHIPYTSTHVQEHDYKLHEIVTNFLRGSCIRYHQYIVGVSGPTHFTDINSLDDVL